MQNYIKKLLTPLFGTITHISTADRIAALTFDDGPHSVYTPKLLDILDQHDAKGTFFVVGDLASKNPGIIDRIGSTGHVVACHSWDHPAFPWISRKDRRRQVKKVARVISAYDQGLFRLPFGFQDLWSFLDVRLLGYKVVGWNVHAEDWVKNDGESLAQTLVSKLMPGCIILLHDNLYCFDDKCSIDRQPTLEAVDALLSDVGNEFEFVTVPELLRRGRIQKRLISRRGNLKFLSGLKKSQWSNPESDVL